MLSADHGIDPSDSAAQRSLRILQIIASLDLASAGPTYSVTRLSQALAARHTAVKLMTTGTPRYHEEENSRRCVYQRDFPRVPLLNRLCLSRELNASLGNLAEGSVLHVHGLWSMPTIYPAWHAREHGIPLIHSPRGMLAPEALSFSARRKKFFLALAQRSALNVVTCFHATCQKEAEEVRAFGLKAPIAVIPNGVDLPDVSKNTSTSDATRAQTVLYIGRVHPKKKIDNLIRAWAYLANDFPHWRLRIVGPSEIGYVEQLKKLSAKLRLKRVLFENGLFGAEKLKAYHEASIFVLPTLNENFGMVVAEALAAGTPVISTKGAPWAGLSEHRCGWWIDHGTEPLVGALREAMTMPREALMAMGTRGRAWMARDFSWDRIAADMIEVYRWLKGGCDRPQYVSIEV